MQSKITVIPSLSIAPGRILVIQDQRATFDGPITAPWQAWAMRDGAFVLMNSGDKQKLDKKIGHASGTSAVLASDTLVIKDERH